jgi:inhibitor of cysteine peptidase
MRSLVGAAFIAMFAGCSLMPSSTGGGSSPAATDIRLTETDSGKDRFVRVGQRIEITLPANHTTGFAWAMVPDTSTIVAAEGQPDYTENPGQALGRGGVETWHFKANHLGTQTLRFEYRRAFDKNALPSRTASFNIRVN